MADASPQPTRNAFASLDPVGKRLTAAGAPFETADSTLDGRPVRLFRNAPDSIGAIIRQAATFGDQPCLVGLDYRLTYSDVLTSAGALRAALVERGLSAGTRCAIAIHNRPEWVIAFIAVAAIGATPVLVNYRASSAELASALSETESMALIAEPEIANRAAPHFSIGSMIVTTGRENGPADAPSFDALIAAHRGAPLEPVLAGPEDEGVIIFTSGTSGHPKGALISQCALMNMVESIDYATLYGALQAGIDPSMLAAAAKAAPPSAMLVFPLFHTAGVIAVLLPNLRRGGKMAMLERWRVDDAITLIEREKVIGFSGSPAMLWDLLKADRDGRDLSSLRFLSIGGQGISRRLMDELITTFPGLSIGIGYGQTETGSVNGISGANLLARPTATGRPLPIIDARIVDDDGTDLPPGEVGEVWIGGVTIMRGYCNRPAETAAVLRDGFVATGDLGRIDDEGYLHIVDRKKNIVVSGGENIGCGEVEDAATSHPSVEQAIAFALPDERMGETLHLAVIAAEGAVFDPETIRGHIASRLAPFKVPKSVSTVDQFPLNAMGKVDRRALAAALSKEPDA